jgi:hypothetical protein
VFSGASTSSTFGDCWQLPSAGNDEWVELPVTNATPRAYGACTADPREPASALLFGGIDANGLLVATTMQWNREDARFEAISPATSPPPRWITAMAYDSARGRVVLFGGGDYNGPLADTWEWDGFAWQQRFPAQAPAPRANHAMAYDAARGRVVLHGGHDGWGSIGDTWTWDGSNWTAATSASGPGALHNAMLAYDPTRAVTVLFGGKDDFGGVRDSLWEWDGSAWLGPWQGTAGIPARELASLTYDAQRRQLVVVGGRDQGGAALADAWALGASGSNVRPWSRLSPRPITIASGPSSRTAHAAAYDSTRRRMVAFGGCAGLTLGDTVETDGVSWTTRLPATPPSMRFGARRVWISH